MKTLFAKSDVRAANHGQILILALVVLGFVLINTLVIIGSSLLYSQNSFYSLERVQALHLAEAGIDKAITSINKTAGSYNGETETSLEPGSFSITVTSPDASTKIIESTGYVPTKKYPKAKRTVKITAQKGTGVSFKYGVQVGEGGLQLGSSDQIIGSVYSNGNITGVNNNVITGDAWVAGGTQPNPDQQADCADINCSDFVFGTNVSNEERVDVAQSFKQSVSAALNKVSLKLKKVGSPSDITVRILGDKNGLPDKNTVLASGTLSASLVSSSYSFVDVTFTQSPNLLANTPYWILLDSSSSFTNWWVWQQDSAQSYTLGKPVYTSDWQAGNATWSPITSDLAFKTYIGGASTFIDGTGSLTIQGSAHANTLKNLTVVKDAYYQAIANITASSYHPGSPDPVPKPFPISTNNISDWQRQAQDAGVFTGDIESCKSVLGPGKYVGNVTFDTRCLVTIKSPVWITGNLLLKNNNTLILSSEFAATSGVIIVDGTTELQNGNRLSGTGQPNSNLMLLSTYDSRSSGISAIVISNTGNSSFLYADKGVIQPGNSNTFTELTAWGIKIFNSSTVSYASGLASSFFSTGPSGSYSIVRGTYQLK